MIAINDSTVAFNQSSVANGGGGLFNAGSDSLNNPSRFEISNSIIASNTAVGHRFRFVFSMAANHLISNSV